MAREEPEVTSNPSEVDEETPVVSSKLKFLVIGQGIAILILIVVIIGTLAYRAMKYVMAEPTPITVSTTVSEVTALPVTTIKAGSLLAPQGSKLHKVHAGDVTVTLEFLHESGQTTLIFVDVITGLEHGRLVIKGS